MSYHKSPADCQRFQIVRQEFLQADGLAFSEILSEEQIEQTFDEAGTWYLGCVEDHLGPPSEKLQEAAWLPVAIRTNSPPYVEAGDVGFWLR